MPSTFPGMDPYLEAHWGDVHASAIIYARDQLNRVLPKDLRARAEERVVVAGLERPRPVFPDVRVVERRKLRKANNGGAGSSLPNRSSSKSRMNRKPKLSWKSANGLRMPGSSPCWNC